MERKGFPVACFAPPLTDDMLAQYRALAEGLPDARGELRDALRECLAAVELWWQLPESERTDGPRFDIRHQGAERTYAVTPLEEEHRRKLYDLIPWPREIDGMQRTFDEIPVSEKAIRDAAFHLLWHVKELNLDREPLTADKL